MSLPATIPGLKQVYREGDPDADRLRQPIDFYSPDTFNYVTLELSADGKSLAVDTWGIDSYPPNSSLFTARCRASEGITRLRRTSSTRHWSSVCMPTA